MISELPQEIDAEILKNNSKLPSFLGQKMFVFRQFSGNIDQIIGWQEILDPYTKFLPFQALTL